jgi:ribosomal protein L11 methylase PrmA
MDQHGAQHGVVIVVVATTEKALPAARTDLAALGLGAEQVACPTSARRLLLVPVEDESSAARLVTRLRALGYAAVMRPAGGPRLEAWSRHTRPTVIGTQLSMSFVWSEHDRDRLPNLVELDPDGGFGTGHHPSTRLLLEELVSRVAGGERVLDVGCGSGVLGLCALRLGAASVVGVDIDAQAIESTRRNAALNGMEQRVVATLGRLDQVEGTFDVVVANIGRAALVELAPELMARVGSTGWVAVSGFSPALGPTVAACFRPFAVVAQRECDDWAALVIQGDLA